MLLSLLIEVKLQRPGRSCFRGLSVPAWCSCKIAQLPAFHSFGTYIETYCVPRERILCGLHFRPTFEQEGFFHAHEKQADQCNSVEPMTRPDESVVIQQLQLSLSLSFFHDAERDPAESQLGRTYRFLCSDGQPGSACRSNQASRHENMSRIGR